MFDKSESLFPVKRDYIYLSHCAIGPMYRPAADAAKAFIDTQVNHGLLLNERYAELLTTFRQKVATFLKTAPENIAYVSNTAEGINLIANGYPFESGDQVISYVHEFPSNHHPWALQKKRGVELVLLSNVDPFGDVSAYRPCAWSMQELEEKTTDRTRVVAISHVQFASGYAADLKQLGDFCRERNVDLVIDAAQSMGVLPFYPEEYGIAAVATSAWKWLLASRGAGLLYTSPELREKLQDTMAGGGMMKHRLDYLNHTWDPFENARRFEYSTLPWEHLVAIETVLEELFLRYEIEAISAEVFRLQDRMLEFIDTKKLKPLNFPPQNRSGILALATDKDPMVLANALKQQGVVMTAQSKYLRLAPHFYLTEEEILKAAEILNALAGE